jgi:hypothetical protein
MHTHAERVHNAAPDPVTLTFESGEKFELTVDSGVLPGGLLGRDPPTAPPTGWSATATTTRCWWRERPPTAGPSAAR